MNKRFTNLLGLALLLPPQLAMAEPKRLKRTLATVATMAFIGLGSANAQTDVTSTYIDNADFSTGTPVVSNVCGYDTDLSKNNTTLKWAQEVESWTIASEQANGRAGALFAYGSTPMLCGNSKAAPATNPDGDASGNALGICAVWGATIQYTQDAKVSLPAGEYTLSCTYYNQSGSDNITTNLIGFVESGGTTHYLTNKTFTVGAWTTGSITFTLSEETSGKFSIGYVAKGGNSQAGSGYNPMLFIDNIKLLHNAVSKTDLVAAIASATAANATLANSDLTAAITKAQGIADSKTATKTEVDAAIAELNNLVATASTTALANVSYLLTNPSFEEDIKTGWTQDGSISLVRQSNTSFGKTGSYYAEYWQPAKDINIYQTVKGLSKGVYALGVKAKARGVTSAAIYLGTTEKAITIADSEADYFIVFESDGNADSEYKIGYKAQGSGASQSWVAIDNFRLTYLAATTDALPALESVEGAMNADVKTAQTSAVSTYNDSKTFDNCALALEAIEKAKTSIAAYASLKTVLDNRADLLTKTNFYKADDSFYTTPLAAYNNGTLTDAEATSSLEDPYVVSNWHAYTQLNKFFGAAWGVSDFSSSPYVNTWSKEGETDGSNFKVPFYEYWTSESGTLADKTLTGTISSLKANTTYSITADVRVQIYDKGTAPSTGITMQVGDGEEVTITGGTTYTGTDTKTRYIGTYTAIGKTDAEGNLTLKFNVASTNVSWLSFQHVWYTEVPTVELSEEATYTPAEEESLANVTLTRTLTTNWNTIVLPFALSEKQVKAAFGETAKVAEYTGATVDGDNTTLKFATVTETKANTPYMICPAEAGQTYTFEAVTIEKASDLSVGSDDIKFVGNYTNGKALTKGDYFIDASDNKFYSAVGTETMKSFRAIFHADNISAAKLNISIDGETTGISNIDAKTATSNDVYSVSGVLVKKGAKSLNGLAKGVYIVNGKSVIVK